MPHYICTGGCAGVSQEPGVCSAEECPKNSESLDSCDCEDGEHGGREEGESPVAGGEGSPLEE